MTENYTPPATDDVLTPFTEKDLPVALTKDEKLDRFLVAADLKKEKAKLEAQYARSKDEWKERIGEVATKVEALELAATTGKENRPVPCYERFKGGSVETVRFDTREVAFVRTATPSDRQVVGSGLLDEAERALAGGQDEEDDQDTEQEAEDKPAAARRKKR